MKSYIGDERNWIIPLSEHMVIRVRTRKMPKTEEYPIGVEFAAMGFLENPDEEIIRIDNLPHQQKPGTHIHFFDKEPRKGKPVVEYTQDITNPEQARIYAEQYLRKRYPQWS